MKIRVRKPDNHSEIATLGPTVTRGNSIPHLTMFTGRIGGYHDYIFIKAGSTVYSLTTTDEGHSWSWGGDVPVNNYKPIDIAIVERRGNKKAGG